MAGLKKPNRKKDSASPNVVLVIFLVFFILLSIGLGVWGYYGYAGQEKLLADANSKKATADANGKLAVYYETLADTYRLALGIGDKLPADEVTFYSGAVPKLDTDYAAEKSLPDHKKAIDESKKLLGWDAQKFDFTESLKAKYDKLSTDLVAAQASLKTREEELAAAKKQFETLLVSQEKYAKLAQAKIDAGNAAALAASGKRTGDMTKSIEEVVALNLEVQTVKREKDEKIEQLNRQVELLKNKVTEQSAQKADPVSATRNPNDVHALLLDISTGKPLWDNPLGKITRVDLGKREVTINLGSDDGVQPEATFTVFGAGAYGRAEKHLKGMLEVVRVLGPHQAMARITALYDDQGLEIDPTETTQQRIRRAAESALREGDLLHNMFWGSHVAIAGPVTLTGKVSDNPVAQMRQLDDFRYHLARMGMTVDAYLDLTDGQVKGAMTPATRYLIRGEEPVVATDAKKPVEAKEGEAAPADAADPKAEQGKTQADAMAAMRKDATAKGMFIISTENFLVASGYRRPLANVSRGGSTFRPAAPAAGTPSIFAPAPRPAAAAEAKDPAKEEK